MPGLVPGIHVLGALHKTWMAGTSPAMTLTTDAASSAAPTKSALRWPRRRATTARTSRAAAPAAARAGHLYRAPPSVIPRFRVDLAAEHPVGERGVGDDHRDQDRHADQHELLALGRRRGLPDRDALRHDKRIHADAKPGIGDGKQHQCQDERSHVLPP